jgi:cysteine synthase A
MMQEQHPVPAWIVIGAGTGGTSATLGRYIRYQRLPTRLCLADPEASVFHRHLADRRITSVSVEPSLVEGIGRPRCEPSFIPELIDRVYPVPDPASIASARVLSRRIGRSCGGSTGTNLWAVAKIVAEMADRGERGSVVTLLCDSGERYRSTLLDDAWLKGRAIDVRPAEEAMERFFDSGVLGEPPRD